MKKKLLAFVLSAVMVAGSSMTVFASSGGSLTGTATAPIYSFDVVDVVVPTTMLVAFNPDGLDVKNGSDTSTEQVVSQNFGIVNKSNKDKVVTVGFAITDKNSGKINFVSSEAEATEGSDFSIYLTAVPASAAPTLPDDSAIDKDIATGSLAGVKMSPASGKGVVLTSGGGSMSFKLDKATYSLKSGSDLDISDTTQGNDVSALYEVSALGTNGVTGYTFTGKMNTNAAWHTLASGIEISAVYNVSNPTGDEQAVAGTCGVVTVPVPTSDGTVEVRIPFKGTKPVAGSIKIVSPQGSEYMAPANTYPNNIEVTGTEIVIKTTWLNNWKTLDGWGLGTYTVTDGSESYEFKLVDALPVEDPMPTSDGTTAVSIKFTGAKPAAGSVSIKPPVAATAAFTPQASAYPANIEITDDAIVIKATWLTNWKTMDGWGTGKYTVTANGQTYEFNLK